MPEESWKQHKWSSGMTGYEQGAAEYDRKCPEKSFHSTEYDKASSTFKRQLLWKSILLLSDASRDLSSYMDFDFDEETFFETEKRLDLINGLKAKYGQTIHEILSYQKNSRKN